MTRRDFVKPAFSLRKETLRENTCTIASGDYSTPVSQRGMQQEAAVFENQKVMLLAFTHDHGQDSQRQ